MVETRRTAQTWAQNREAIRGNFLEDTKPVGKKYRANKLDTGDAQRVNKKLFTIVRTRTIRTRTTLEGGGLLK